MRRIKKLAHFETKIKVVRQNQVQEISSTLLVPGDIIQVEQGIQLPCDCLLIKGFTLIDESLLTGETTKVSKVAIDDLNQNPSESNAIYAGTIPSQVDQNTLALVKTTGFHTRKGKLILAILNPKPDRFEFERDSYKFIMGLSIVALLGFAFTVAIFLEHGVQPRRIIISALDLITIIIPPGLPLALTIGIAFANKRLKYYGISCIQLNAINTAGAVQVAVFDKTGTLTQNEMIVEGAWDGNNFFENLLDLSSIFKDCIQYCNTVQRDGGNVIGDEMELAIDRLLQSKYNVRDDVIKKAFYFCPIKKRMGVIVEINAMYFYFTKGAPDVLLNLSYKDKWQWLESIQKFEHQGKRLLGFGFKQIYDLGLDQSRYEESIQFLGLIVLQNDLKIDAPSTILNLSNSNISCLMSTGDSIYTAVNIAQQSGILNPQIATFFCQLEGQKLQITDIDQNPVSLSTSTFVYELAVSGAAFNHILYQCPQLLLYIYKYAKVFARMSPKDKVKLIEWYQDLNHLVCMIGDGANDCGALRQADIGLSVSQAESSIASPFTAAKLEKLVNLLCEGRAALANSFQAFKFIIMYSVLQFISVNILYTLNDNYTDSQFVYQDLFVILPLAVLMGRTYGLNQLNTQQPYRTLINWPIIVSLVGQSILFGSLLIFTQAFIKAQDWYKPGTGDLDNPQGSIDNSTIIILSTFQLVAVSLVYSIGWPFRQPVYKNTLLILAVALILIYNTAIVYTNELEIQDLMQIQSLPLDFQIILTILMINSLALSFLFEKSIPRLLRFFKKD